ncbi:MAG: NADH-quinone oxidoreductase subunit C [Planctomycetes bacterium]|nr:NADH-quinone oxidoreductase subunit C [Planctomycetota bacterium]
MSETAVLQLIKSKFPHVEGGDEFVIIQKDQVIEIMTFLKTNSELSFDCLMDLTAVDYKGYIENMPGRFCIVYTLYSFKTNRYLRVKVFLSEENPEIPTASAIWKSADWAEREVYDLFGIKFSGHPNLTRILLPDSFKHNPLRKEYPLKGVGERESFTPYYLPRET